MFHKAPTQPSLPVVNIIPTELPVPIQPLHQLVLVIIREVVVIVRPVTQHVPVAVVTRRARRRRRQLVRKPPQSCILDGWGQAGFQWAGSSVVISDCFIAGRRCKTSRRYSHGSMPRRRQLTISV